MKSDARIQRDVLDQIHTNPQLGACDIEVAVKDGVVTVVGQVNSFLKKMEVEKEIKKVAGVRAMVEDIEVTLAPSHQKSDSEIAHAALFALRWDTSIPDDKIKIKVEHGFVTLEGEVEWRFQREAARHAVARLAGVRSVFNTIKIKPKAQPDDLRKMIHAAFHRLAVIDASRIQVEVKGAKVLLSGKVASYAEKEEAEYTAWSAPGIQEVENKLEIMPSQQEAVRPGI
jgi:osmotically-inducible protein OsmY